MVEISESITNILPGVFQKVEKIVPKCVAILFKETGDGVENLTKIYLGHYVIK